MIRETVRTHVVLPKELVEAVDSMVGQRRRSQFVEEAVKEKVARERQRTALEELARAGGVLSKEDHPEWATPEQTSAWVRQLRTEADAATVNKIRPGHPHDAPSA